MTSPISGVEIPDSRLAREAAELVRSYEDEMLLNHSVRVYVFGALKGIWYSVLTGSGMYITNTKSAGKPVIKGGSLNMGATVCNGRILFSSTREPDAGS